MVSAAALMESVAVLRDVKKVKKIAGKQEYNNILEDIEHFAEDSEALAAQREKHENQLQKISQAVSFFDNFRVRYNGSHACQKFPGQPRARVF